MIGCLGANFIIILMIDTQQIKRSRIGCKLPYYTLLATIAINELNQQRLVNCRLLWFGFVTDYSCVNKFKILALNLHLIFNI